MTNQEIATKIKEKIKLHNELYRFPVKAELWEDIFDQIINPNNSDWEDNMGNHDTGGDTKNELDGTTYQNKSGQLDLKNNTLKWSGSRTTGIATIEEKLEFFDKEKYDQYAFLARSKKEWDKGVKKYYFIIMDPKIIDYKSLNWSEAIGMKKGKNLGKRVGWKADGSNYSAAIQGACGDQLWTTINLDYLKQNTEIFEIEL